MSKIIYVTIEVDDAVDHKMIQQKLEDNFFLFNASCITSTTNVQDFVHHTKSIKEYILDDLLRPLTKRYMNIHDGDDWKRMAKTDVALTSRTPRLPDDDIFGMTPGKAKAIDDGVIYKADDNDARIDHVIILSKDKTTRELISRKMHESKEAFKLRIEQLCQSTGCTTIPDID